MSLVNICYVLGCITSTLLSIDGNNDPQKYTQILDANLWSVVVEHLVKVFFIPE